MNKTSSVKDLQRIAKDIRISIIRMLAEAGSGHTGGSLGLADIFTSLYFNILNHEPKKPDWADRDRLILSIGHVAPVLYATLAEAGYFPKEELITLRKLNSRLQGHPARDHSLPGIELSAGSLGQGLSVAVGLALAAKADKKSWHVYCINGDGEMQEGSIWEAAMSAAFYKLNNLTVIVDRNNCQIDGNTSKVMEIEPLGEKWKAFGWEVFECDGHSHTDIIKTCEFAGQSVFRPSVILAKTKMGRGVKSIEDDYRWHGKAPSKEEAEDFIKQLKV
ncbi:MAG: transketolase [Bacteroidales bacterium]|jgi:transketolase